MRMLPYNTYIYCSDFNFSVNLIKTTLALLSISELISE